MFLNFFCLFSGVFNGVVVFLVRCISRFKSIFYLVGVHAVLKTGNWVRYCIFDLATGKAEQENNFPTSNMAFLGQNERNIAIFTAGQVRLCTKPLFCVLLGFLGGFQSHNFSVLI